MKKYNRSVLMIIIMCFVLSAFFGGSRHAYAGSNSGDVQIDATVGMDGYIVSGKNVPIYISVSNGSSDIKGYIELLIEDESGNVISYRKPLTLPQGEEREVYYELGNFSSDLYFVVRVIDSKGKEIARTKNPITSKAVFEGTMIMGVLTTKQASSYPFNKNDIRVNKKIIFIF